MLVNDKASVCLACGDESASFAVIQKCGSCVGPTKYAARQTDASAVMDYIFGHLELKDWCAAATAGVVALNPLRVAHMRGVKKFSGCWFEPTGRHSAAARARRATAGISWLILIE